MNNLLHSSLYKSFLIAGLIAFIVGFFTQTTVSFNAYISGYFTLLLGIIMLISSIFNKISRTQNSELQSLYNMFMSTGPFLLLLGIIIFMLYLMIFNQNKIISGNISSNYTLFNNVIILLLIVQIYIITNNINTDEFKERGKISSVILSILYFLSMLLIISEININIILTSYTTDGFTF